MSEYTEDWFSKNIPIWEQALGDLKDKPVTVLELGTYEGRSAIWLAEYFKEGFIHTVDTFKGGVEHSDIDMQAVKDRAYKNTEPYPNIAIWEQKTTEFFRFSSMKFDVIYIDASHEAADVMTDAVFSHLALNPGGIIIFDDYLWGGLAHAPNVPRTAIDAFMECYSNFYDVIHIGYQVILRKKNEKQTRTTDIKGK